jgi:hypothetical protein
LGWTAETEFEKLGKNKTNKKKRKKKNKDATPTQECLPDIGEQPLLKVGTFDGPPSFTSDSEIWGS